MGDNGLIGPLIQVAALALLMRKIWTTQSCSGISGKTLILYALVFITRDLGLGFIRDLGLGFYFIISTCAVYLVIFKFGSVSSYDSEQDSIRIHGITVFRMEMLLIPLWYLGFLEIGPLICIFRTTAAIVICYFIYIKFKDTYESELDSFRNGYIILIMILAGAFAISSQRYSDFLPAFSSGLESLAMLPQFFMTSKAGKIDTTISFYLFAMAVSRPLYAFDTEDMMDFYDYASNYDYDWTIILQLVINYVGFRWCHYNVARKAEEDEEILPIYESCDEVPAILTENDNGSGTLEKQLPDDMSQHSFFKKLFQN